MSKTIGRLFAHWASNLQYEDLPPIVIDKVKALILAPLVSATIGASQPKARGFLELLAREESRADGARIVTDGTRVSRNAAAIANCAVFRASGLYDSYRMITHPGPSIVASAFASADIERSSGKQLITALATGFETHCRLCYDFVPSTSAHGFRPSPIFATMGVATSTAKLLGLDEDRFMTAIAIAAGSAAGLNEPSLFDVSNEIELHELGAARQGTYAAVMASTGLMEGSETAIEGKAGFYRAYAGSEGGKLKYAFTGPLQIDLSSITNDLGGAYKLLDVMFRLYRAGGPNAPVIDLMTELKARHKFGSADVSEIVIAVNYLETLYPSPEFPRSPDPSEASVGTAHYYCAHVAVNGGYPVVGGKTYGPTGSDLAADERVLAFMEKVRVVGVHDQELFSPEITIFMNDGSVYQGNHPYSRMSLNFDQLVNRVQACVPGIPGGKARLDALIEAVKTCETFDSVDPLMEIVQSI